MSPLCLFSAFVQSFVQDHRLTIGSDDVRIGAVQFHTSSSLLLYLDEMTTAADVAAFFSTLAYNPASATMIGKGFETARLQVGAWDRGRRPEAQNIYILITDGYGDTSNAIRQANIAKSQGTYVLTVGVGGNIYEDFLRELSSGNYMYHIQQWGDMPGFVDTLLEATCQITYDLGRYTIIYLRSLRSG